MAINIPGLENMDPQSRQQAVQGWLIQNLEELQKKIEVIEANLQDLAGELSIRITKLESIVDKLDQSIEFLNKLNEDKNSVKSVQKSFLANLFSKWRK